MTDYYLYKTQQNERWDTLATKFYGNCFEIEPIIEANPHVQITPTLPAGIEIRIPVKENQATTKGLPIWKQ